MSWNEVPTLFVMEVEYQGLKCAGKTTSHKSP